MKTMFYLLITSLICVGAIFGGLYSGNILLGYGIAFGVLAVVAWKIFKSGKKASARKMREEVFFRHWRTVQNNKQR